MRPSARASRPDELIAKLASAHRHKALIPFVGAGISASIGIPAWSGLIDLIGADLNFEPDVFATHGTALQLAEFAELTNTTIGPIRELMSQHMHTSTLDDRRRSSNIHRLLATSSFPKIYTTNFDYHIERAFKDHGTEFRLINSIRDLQTPKPDNSTDVVKFHGSLTDDNSLVLSETRYFDRLLFEHPLDIVLRSDVMQNNFIFLGYSFQDINIRMILYRMTKIRKEASGSVRSDLDWLNLAVAATGLGEIQVTILKSWGVDVIELDPEDLTGSVNYLLEQIVA